MEFTEFLKELNELGYGLAAANTYHVKDEVVPNGTRPKTIDGHYNCMPGYYFYVTAAGGGDKSICYKREGLVDNSRMILFQLCDDIRQDIIVKLLRENGGSITLGRLNDMVLALGKSNYHGKEGSQFHERMQLTLVHLQDKGIIKPVPKMCRIHTIVSLI